MEQNSVLMMQGAQTTKIMYVGGKSVKRDTVSGYWPQMQFKRNEPTDTPMMIAQALLAFDCFVPATEQTMEDALQAEQEAIALAELKEKKLAEAQALELDLSNSSIELDGETIDINKMSFAAIETLCLANDIDIKRGNDGGKQEDKPTFAVRVRKAFEAKQAESEA